MPLYEYECERRHRFSRIRSVAEAAATAVCPYCGGVAQRIMSSSLFRMGWEHLKAISEKSEPAPEHSGYAPKWDD